MRRQTALVFRWTLLQQLRDPSGLLVIFLIPVLLNPVALWLGDRFQSRLQGKDAQLLVRVPEELAQWILPEDQLELVSGPHSEDNDSRALASVEPARDGEPARIHYRSIRQQSVLAKSRLETVLQRFQEHEVDVALEQAGLGITYQQVLDIQERDLATSQESQAGLLGRLLPLILLFVVMNAAMLSALDAITGERERSTLETILSSGVNRLSLLMGKVGVVVGVALLSGLLALMSLWASLALGLYHPSTGGLDLPFHAIPWLLVLFLPVTLFLGLVTSLVAAQAPDFRTGQFNIAMLMLVVLAMAGVSAFPSLSLSAFLALVPVSGVAMAMREVMVGHYQWGLLALVLLASLLHLGLAVYLGARMVVREDLLSGRYSVAERRALGRFAPEVGGIFALCLLANWFLGQRVQSLDFVWGTAFTQVVIVMGLALGGVIWVGARPSITWQLRWPGRGDTALALVAGLGAPGISLLLARVQAPLLPIASSYREQVNAALDLDLPMPVLLALFAALPALSEELLFRGTLLGLLRRHSSPIKSVLVVALLFGTMHMQVVRVLPTTCLGLLLGAAAMRGRSLLLPMGIHVIHNGLLVLLGYGHWFPDGDPPMVLLLPMAFLSVASVAAMGRRP